MLTITEVRRRARGEPRVHGNGFIQLDLDGTSRVNVWGHPDIPCQEVDTGIHNHRFGFRSTVIRGRVVNAEWAVINVPGSGPYKLYAPVRRAGEDTELVDTGARCAAALIASTTVLTGASYEMRPGFFHETFTDRPSITLMEKTSNDPSVEPRVLVPSGLEPDNEFERSEFSPVRLWGIIEQVFSKEWGRM